MERQTPYKIMRITTVPLSLHKLLNGQMRFMREEGFDVLMVSSDGPEIAQVVAHEGCNHEVVRMTRQLTPLQDFIALFRLIFLMIKYKPDIVHTHTPKAGMLGMLASWILQVPVRMHTVAGLPWMEAKGIKRTLLRLTEKITAGCAQYVFVNSRSLLEFMKCEKIVKDPGKMQVLGCGTSNGINLDIFSNNAAISRHSKELKRSAGLKEDGQVWLFVGRLVTDKGIRELFEAFCELHHEFPNDQLWLVGPAETHNSMPAKLMADLSTHPGVINWEYQEDVRPFMVAAYALVFPSYREGFPNVPLQAAAMGCTLILSDINGCNEIVKNEVNGLLVPVKDYKQLSLAMLRMRKDKDMRLAFVENTLQIVKDCYAQSYIHQSLKSEYLNALNTIKG